MEEGTRRPGRDMGHGDGWQWERDGRQWIYQSGGPRTACGPTLRAFLPLPSPSLPPSFLLLQSLSPLVELRSLDPAAPSYLACLVRATRSQSLSEQSSAPLQSPSLTSPRSKSQLLLSKPLLSVN